MSIDVGLAASAVSLYVSTCRLAMSASAIVNTDGDDNADAVVVDDAEPSISVNNNNNNNYNNSDKSGPGSGRRCPSVHWTELYRQLSCLRQALTCTHCSRIATDPVEAAAVPMIACRSCITRNDASSTTSTVVQLRIVVQCYQKLCEFLESTRVHQGELGGVSANGDTRTLADLIVEGSALGSIRANRPAVERPADGHHFLLSRLLSSPPMSSAQLRNNEILACNGLRQDASEAVKEATEAATAPRSYSVSMDVDRSTRITIKRKHKSASSSSTSSSSMSSSSSDSLPLATYAAAAASGGKRLSRVCDDRASTSSLPASSVATKSGAAATRGCRCHCGSATLLSRKLTVNGQRCSCYVDGVACDKCKCRCCKNPVNALDDDGDRDPSALHHGKSSKSSSASSTMSSDSCRSTSSSKPSAATSTAVRPSKTLASRKSHAACRRRTKP